MDAQAGREQLKLFLKKKKKKKENCETWLCCQTLRKVLDSERRFSTPLLCNALE